MFCPKCGTEAVEGQRFCKTCGTKLELIINIIKGGGKGPGPWNFDPEELKRNITDFAHSWKSGWQQFDKGRPYRNDARELRRRAKEEVRRRNLPQPNQWMHYSRQHNLKEGLISLFSGSALAFVFFKIG